MRILYLTEMSTAFDDASVAALYDGIGPDGNTDPNVEPAVGIHRVDDP